MSRVACPIQQSSRQNSGGLRFVLKTIVKHCVNFILQYQRLDSKTTLQENETTPGINLLQMDYVNGKECKRWYCSFKFKFVESLNI